MGLDMYLKYRQSMSGYDFSGNDPRPYNDTIEAAGLTGISTNDSPFAEVIVTAIYWRKANAVHAWIVNELADGVDECQEIRVPREKLAELRSLCFDALSIPAGSNLQDHAASVLPPASGFFFGSTEIDDWYVKDLEHTMSEIDRVLSLLPEEGEGWDWSLVYQASW
jgi:hypothetical protein